MEESTDIVKNKNCSRICLKWIRTPAFLLLCNFLLSQWGDWMWQFSAGLYLVHLSEGQLRLAAVFGFTGGTCVLLFGGIIGDWVDKNGRLKVVRVSLLIQNISVALSASCVCLVLAFESTYLSHEHLVRNFMEAAIVILAVIAQLASVAYKIAIEKDWIIIIASGKSNILSNLNALTRSLDLLCKILSPLTAGFIMSKFSMFVSAYVIAIWNVSSVFVEYFLLTRIYYMVPQLAKKGIPEATETEMTLLKEIVPSREGGDETTTEGKTPNQADIMATPSENKVEVSTNKSCLHKIFEPFIILVVGWKMYAKQSVVYAGISLACLYMTVLGFDSITLGYIYANNISEFLVGISMGMAGVTGIVGTFLFALMAKRLGLERTGIFAFLAELSWLVLALASVWAPGSKFNPRALFTRFGDVSMNPSNFTNLSDSTMTVPPMTSSEDYLDSSVTLTSSNLDLSTTPNEVVTCSPPSLENISMVLLLIGIIMSRIGLWMADLVVTQLMQESIPEQERGIVNGVQNSLNMTMDMLKFVLVIFLPRIEVFGLHIILSFTFISAGAAFFCHHVRRANRRKRREEELRRKQNNNNVADDAVVEVV